MPRSFKVLLEVSHAHFFAMGILLLTVTHLLLFAPGSQRMKIGLMSTTFISALLNEGSNWLIRYVHPHFAYLKVTMFIVFQVALLLVIALVVGGLWGKWLERETGSADR